MMLSGCRRCVGSRRLLHMGSQGHRRPSRCTIAVAASAAGADEGAANDTITAIKEAAKNEAKERVAQAEELVAEAKEAAEKKGTLKDTITALKLENAQLVKEAEEAKQKAKEAKQKAEEAKQAAMEAKKAKEAADDMTALHATFWLVVLVGLIMWPSRRQESSFQAQPPGFTYVFVSEATYVRLPQAGRPSPIAEDTH